MLQATLIGNIGANAEVQNADGREFITFRVAHNDSYKGSDGNKVTTTMWVDCTMNCDNGRPAVLPYLTAGALVYVTGTLKTRVYSSAKDRCMKAGITIKVQRIELLGGAQDSIPRRLYTSDGEMLDVNKYYNVNAKSVELLDQRGNVYSVDNKGWVTPKQSDNNGEDNR